MVDGFGHVSVRDGRRADRFLLARSMAPALVADVVFAKSSLARALDARAVPYLPFETLEPVLAHLETI